jgi:glucose/arabinose dehydrogenase
MSGAGPGGGECRRMSGMRRAIAAGAVLAALAGLASCTQSSAAPQSAATQSAASTAAGVPQHAPAPAVVAAGLHFPVNLTFDSRGGIWFTSSLGLRSPTNGVWYIPLGGRPRQVVTGLPAAGLLWVGNSLYVASVTAAGAGEVTVFEGFNGTRFTSQRVRLAGLTVGPHIIGSIALGPDGRLYIGVGAAGDHSGPPGSVLSFAPEGGNPVVKATGLRSPFGLAFYGRLLLVTDTARDDLGPFRPPEKLNEFNPAGPVVNFGFPGCYDQGGPACAGTRPPMVTFAAHATPAGVAVKGQVAFVVLNGSSFLQNPSGSDVQRVDLRTGQNTVFWRSPVKHDPVGATIGPDGNLYITLVASGEILEFKL